MILLVAALDAGEWFREAVFDPGRTHGTPMPDRRFRVNDPDVVIHPQFHSRREVRSAGLMLIELDEDLRHVEGAELALELWGGHPGTAGKRVTVNGRESFAIPENGTAFGHATHLYPTFELKTTSLVRGHNALQFSCSRGSSFWGHYIVDRAALRARLKPEHAALAGKALGACVYRVIVRPAAGEAVEAALDATPACLALVDHATFQARYSGFDDMGDGGDGWHRMLPGATLDLSMIPDQRGMQIRAWIRFKQDSALLYRSQPSAPFATPPRDAHIRLAAASRLPAPFWSRAGRRLQAAIELDIDPARVERATLHTILWDGGAGATPEPFRFNRRALAAAGEGRHDVLWRAFAVDPREMRRGANTVELLSDTEHHGLEVLLPGPVLALRVNGRAPAGALRVENDVEHQGQRSVRVTAPAATYVWHKEGAGLASLIDGAGNDWISYRPGGGAAGEYRGFPNLGAFAHPGYEGERGGFTRVVERGPERARLVSESRDGKYAVQFDVFATHATLTVLRAAAPYWVLYEGTPGGRLDLASQFWLLPDLRPRPLRETWNADIEGQEWAAFADPASGRALVVVNHQDDSANDQFWQMEGRMTVWGFGRQYRCCERYLTATPARYSIALVESVEPRAIAEAARRLR